MTTWVLLCYFVPAASYIANMIDAKFYELLEYKICDALASSEDKQAKHFWCDGVLPGFEHEYSKKYVNDHRSISMTAFCGETGQERYQLIVSFGKKALSRYARGLNISDCLPGTPGGNWFEIDVFQHKIRIQLD